MIDMEHSLIELGDLPDEIILIILKNLENIEVLTSLTGVNKRFSTIARDLMFASHLSLMMCSPDDSVYHPLSEPMLDRFLQISPEIHHKINWLDLESTSIQRILAMKYPNLNRLGLYGIDVEEVMFLFADGTPLASSLKNQILSLLINFTLEIKPNATEYIHTYVFTQILSLFTNLQYLNFDLSSNSFRRLSFYVSPPTVISSTLLELHVSIRSFNDCLYLLDGRFNQLRALYVSVYHIGSSDIIVNNEDELPNLRIFSLRCDIPTNYYDNLIIPLLYRMMNLENLDLSLRINCRVGLVDGNELKKNIINHMPQLNKFTFNIYSSRYFPFHTNLPLNENITDTFRYFHDSQIISCIDYFPGMRYNQCLIYSYPYKLKFYHHLSNNFPGGLFKYVTDLSLYDERPFSHEFFLQIAQAFPMTEILTVVNKKPQIDEQYVGSIIEYLHLKRLRLCEAHADYAEQFLIDTKTCLPNTVSLSVHYKPLERVTHNFQRQATQINCAKLLL